jgi:hypothetical protein
LEPILLAGEVHLNCRFFRRRKGNTLFAKMEFPCAMVKSADKFCLLNILKNSTGNLFLKKGIFVNVNLTDF